MALIQIKQRVLKYVMLHHPNFYKMFYLNCDANGVSLGAVLYKEDENGDNW